MLRILRQMIYPKEFRIEPPNSSLELLDKLNEVVKMEKNAKSMDVNVEKEYLKLLMDIGTGIWRAKFKLQQLDEDNIPNEVKLGLRHLDSVVDSFEDRGFEIKDHNGEAYDYGMALNVLAFQPTPDLSHNTIIETIKPTIYYKDHIIQRGEVIVGKPDKKGEDD